MYYAQHLQPPRPPKKEGVSLSVLTGILSPYFQTKDMRKVGIDRDNNLSLDTMKIIVAGYQNDGGTLYANILVSDGGTSMDALQVEIGSITSSTDLEAAATTSILATAVSRSWPVSNTDISYDYAAFAPLSAVDSALTLSVQTSTGAVGTQISTTHDAWVAVSASVSTTASIAGNAAGDLVLEVAPTNSATAGDWVEKARVGNSQALSLAITLQSVQIVKGQLFGYVPKGYYAKVRSTGFAGTTTGAISSARKILL